jgi:hypothetical protein
MVAVKGKGKAVSRAPAMRLMDFTRLYILFDKEQIHGNY